MMAEVAIAREREEWRQIVSVPKARERETIKPEEQTVKVKGVRRSAE